MHEMSSNSSSDILRMKFSIKKFLYQSLYFQWLLKNQHKKLVVLPLYIFTVFWVYDHLTIIDTTSFQLNKMIVHSVSCMNVSGDDTDIFSD